MDGHTASRRMVLVDGQAGISAAGVAGPMRSAVESLGEVAGSVYGLTVAGEGLCLGSKIEFVTFFPTPFEGRPSERH